MRGRAREQLLGYLTGALDDAETERLAAQLRNDASLCDEMRALRRQLDLLDAAKPQYTPPMGLARRTCEFVFAQARRLARRPRRRVMSDCVTPPGWIERYRLVDVVVSACILVLAGLVVMPAIQTSRFHARLITCEDNLRELGVALTHYSQRHNGSLPQIPVSDTLAGTDINAPPKLTESGWLNHRQRLLCPDSQPTLRRAFRGPSLTELDAAPSRQSPGLRQVMGGSDGYPLGYPVEPATQQPYRLQRGYFAIPADAASGAIASPQTSNHAGRGQNVLFEDGHVECLTTTQPDSVSNDVSLSDKGQVAGSTPSNSPLILPDIAAPLGYVELRP